MLILRWNRGIRQFVEGPLQLRFLCFSTSVFKSLAASGGGLAAVSLEPDPPLQERIFGRRAHSHHRDTAAASLQGKQRCAALRQPLVGWVKDGALPWGRRGGTVELAELCPRSPNSKKLFPFFFFFLRVFRKTIWVSYNGVTG